ncbi:MAG: inorganic diphosphatase [Firmicutes bacterium]|nr:inorganic diphosphatase [Bacillota bacterium]
MNLWHDVHADRIASQDFLSVIEIPKGSKNKYELDKQTGGLILDRILYTSTHYPANYGFIPRTYAEDNDPLDVLIMSNEVITPLALCRCYPIGMVSMLDDGVVDNKIIAIPFKEPSWSAYRDILELPPHIMQEICHFFTVYKALEHKETAKIDIQSKKVAIEVIEKSIVEYKKRFLPGR